MIRLRDVEHAVQDRVRRGLDARFLANAFRHAGAEPSPLAAFLDDEVRVPEYHPFAFMSDDDVRAFIRMTLGREPLCPLLRNPPRTNP